MRCSHQKAGSADVDMTPMSFGDTVALAAGIHHDHSGWLQVCADALESALNFGDRLRLISIIHRSPFSHFSSRSISLPSIGQILLPNQPPKDVFNDSTQGLSLKTPLALTPGGQVNLCRVP